MLLDLGGPTGLSVKEWPTPRDTSVSEKGQGNRNRVGHR